MRAMSVLGVRVCVPDIDFRTGLPFAASPIDAAAMPAMLRRRSSQAVQMAFSATTALCADLGRDHSSLPTVFASMAGELQVTDQLCLALASQDGVVSPSAFHNSVQNAASGYWGIANKCMEPSCALAAGSETFAMSLLEAWCQLALGAGELLLICYDESSPARLDAGKESYAFAAALLLAAGEAENTVAVLEQPSLSNETVFPTTWRLMAESVPVLACLPLLDFIANGIGCATLALSVGGWYTEARRGTVLG
jgi:Beta-ketoacyl synthase, N-terminal domain